MWMVLMTAWAGECVALRGLPEDATAQQLNVAAHNCYEQGLLDYAATILRKAVEVDPDHVLAQYNLACVLARLRAAGEVCENEAYVSSVLEHLANSIRLDPKRRERARVDADLDSVRHTVVFQTLIGTDLSTVEALTAVLPGFELYGPRPGVYPPAVEVSLKKGGVAEWRLRDVLGDDPKVRVEAGSWKVVGPMEVELTGPSGSTRYEVDAQGTFTSSGGTGSTLSDRPDECSA
ncbi:MAG: hypothetical protein H6737_23930 [Alphaproteobacteria bacterium]|nr:hypothetical protein [Alphaproteobacteria bacterium]